MKSLYLFITPFIAAALTFITFQTNFVSKSSGSQERFSGAMQALDFWTIQRAYPDKYIPEDAYYKAYESASKNLSMTNILASDWQEIDRKSTRLNSSHANISYA